MQLVQANVQLRIGGNVAGNDDMSAVVVLVRPNLPPWSANHTGESSAVSPPLIRITYHLHHPIQERGL